MNRQDILATAERYGWVQSDRSKNQGEGLGYLELFRDGRGVEVYTNASAPFADLWNRIDRTTVRTTEKVLDFLKEWGA